MDWDQLAHVIHRVAEKLAWDKYPTYADATPDVAQEALIRLWRRTQHTPLVMQHAKFSTYCWAVVRNAWADHLRGGTKTNRLTTAVSPDDSLWEDTAGLAPSALDVVLQRERVQAVHRVVWSLSVLERPLIVWRMQGVPMLVVADLLDIPVGTVKSRQNRAWGKLRDDLLPYVREVG